MLNFNFVVFFIQILVIMELIIIILINFLFIVSAIFICENLAPIFCLLGSWRRNGVAEQWEVQSG